MISKTAEYALRAIVCLGRSPERCESADILATKTQVPRRYLHKVLQDLSRSGLIDSQSGPGGGYRLARRTTQITILDVVNAVAPIGRIGRCPLGLQSHTKLCPLHQELDDAYAAIEAALSKVTIARLLGSTSPIKALCEVQA